MSKTGQSGVTPQNCAHPSDCRCCAVIIPCSKGRLAASNTASIQTPYAQQGGYTLLLMLVFVSFFGTVLATLVFNKNNSQLRTQAFATGEHVAEVAKAARLFIRDRSLDGGDFTTLAPGDAYHRNRIAPVALAIPMPEGGFGTGPDRLIGIDNLIGAGLLPVGFGDRDALARYFTPLGHEIRIIAANSPLTDDPRTNPNVVATAYIYLIATAETPPEYISDVVIALRDNGVSVSAPRFDSAGNNITTTDCRGAPPVALWDTGCLNLAEFQVLTGEVAFVPGSLIVPAWRAVQFDLRAIMRYPQPENPGYATMLADLRMARELDADGDGACDDSEQIAINDDTGTVPSGICQVDNDDPTAATIMDQDRRFDIRNAAEVTADGIIITPQANDVRTRIDAATGNVVADATIEHTRTAGLAEGLFVSGPAIVRNDVRVYDTMALPATVPADMRVNLSDVTIRRNLIVSDAAASDANQPDIVLNELQTDDLSATDFRQTQPGSLFDPSFMRLSDLTVSGTLDITGGGSATMETVQVFSPNITAETGVMTGTTTVRRVSTTITDASITPAGPLAGNYRAVIAEYGAAGGGTTNINGDLRVSQDLDSRSAVFGGSTETQQLNIHNSAVDARCFGDCPDRVPDPPSPF